jgi:hypothetical protein
MPRITTFLTFDDRAEEAAKKIDIDALKQAYAGSR